MTTKQQEPCVSLQHQLNELVFTEDLTVPTFTKLPAHFSSVILTERESLGKTILNTWNKYSARIIENIKSAIKNDPNNTLCSKTISSITGWLSASHNYSALFGTVSDEYSRIHFCSVYKVHGRVVAILGRREQKLGCENNLSLNFNSKLFFYSLKEVHYRFHESPILNSNLTQLNPVHIVHIKSQNSCLTLSIHCRESH